MSIVPLGIVCVTVLAALALVTRALLARDERRAQMQRETQMHERLAGQPVGDLAAAVVALTAATDALQRTAGERGPTRMGHRVTVHTKKPDDQTIFGRVVGDYTDRISLEEAEYVTPAGGQPIAGRQDIAWTDVAWIDVHGQVTVPAQAPAEA
jgi:hypothetical protein